MFTNLPILEKRSRVFETKDTWMKNRVRFDKRRKEKKVHREALLSISLERLLPQLRKMATRPKAAIAIPFIAICLADNRATS